MKRGWICICMAAVMLLSVWHVPVYALEEEKGIYLALGDSISTGFALDDPEEQGFVGIVAKTLGLEAVNEAAVASTADDVLRKLKRGRLDDEIEGARLITVTCGGNDLMNALYEEIATAYNEKHKTDFSGEDVFDALDGTNEELTATDLLKVALPLLPELTALPAFDAALAAYRQTMFEKDGVIDYIKKRNENAEIILLLQYNPYQSVGGLLTVLNRSIDAGARALNQVITDGARDTGCYVSDVYGAFRQYEDNLCNCSFSLDEMNFDFHPNAKGHRVIADTVLDSYRALEFGPAGYQVGKGSLRIVGFVNTLRYDSLALQVQIEGTKAQQRVIAVNKVYTTLYGMSQGAHLAAVSCDETVTAPYTLPHTYLFGCIIDGLTEGCYTLTAVPVAQKDGMVLQANAVKMKFEVTASGEITVAEEDV